MDANTNGPSPLLMPIGEVAELLAANSDLAADVHRRRLHHWAQHDVFPNLVRISSGRTAARRFRIYHVLMARFLYPFYGLGFTVDQLRDTGKQMFKMNKESLDYVFGDENKRIVPEGGAVQIVTACLLSASERSEWSFRLPISERGQVGFGAFYIPKKTNLRRRHYGQGSLQSSRQLSGLEVTPIEIDLSLTFFTRAIVWQIKNKIPETNFTVPFQDLIEI